MAKYNGHKNWNHWNVSLWINNDEGLYRMATNFIARYPGNRERAAAQMLVRLQDEGVLLTPDGVAYSKTAIRATMVGM